MKTLISLLLLTSIAYAKPKVDKNGCYTKTITVCPLHRPKPKPIAIPAPLVQIEYKTLEVKVPVPVPVTVYKDRVRLIHVPFCPSCPPEPNMVVGLRFGLGLSVQDPYTSGLLGVRLRWPKAWLGLDAYSNFQYGFGFQALFYVYQGTRHGGRVNLHLIDPGVLVTGSPFRNLGQTDVRRNVDLLFGGGLEISLNCHVALTLDARTGIIDPSVLADGGTCRGRCGRRIDRGTAVANGFADTELLLGLLAHN